jgi:CubicO group peptidase (beta-lactamase class C family)
VEQGPWLALRDPVTHLAAGAGRDAGVDRPPRALDSTAAIRPITVEDLMTHRSGLAYAFSVLGPIARAYAGCRRRDADHWLAEVAGPPLLHQPGERLTYSHSTELGSCCRGSRANRCRTC